MPIPSRPLVSDVSARTLSGADFSAALERPTELNWSVDLIEARSRLGGRTAEERLLALFDVIHDLYRRTDSAARAFAINLATITRAEAPEPEDMPAVLGFRQISMTLAAEAELCDPAEFLLSFSLLLKGTVLKAAEGDRKAALRGRAMASDLIQRFRSAPTLSARCFAQVELAGEASDFDLDALLLPDAVQQPAGDTPLVLCETHSAATSLHRMQHSAVTHFGPEDEQNLDTLEDIKWLLS